VVERAKPGVVSSNTFPITKGTKINRKKGGQKCMPKSETEQKEIVSGMPRKLLKSGGGKPVLLNVKNGKRGGRQKLLQGKKMKVNLFG